MNEKEKTTIEKLEGAFSSPKKKYKSCSFCSKNQNCHILKDLQEKKEDYEKRGIIITFGISDCPLYSVEITDETDEEITDEEKTKETGEWHTKFSDPLWICSFYSLLLILLLLIL